MNEIQKQFEEVIKYTQDLYDAPPLKTDSLFNRWKENKAYFIRYFGGYIYEHPEPISVKLSNDQKRDKINSFIDKVNNIYNNNELASFIAENAEGFFQNRVVKSKKKNIPIGMKMIKAFKKFEDREYILKDIENEASMIIQENCLTGKLCFSVHPLDFLTLSENNHNWRSCHALDGEYRAGNLSFMLDKCTFIVYIKSEEDEHLSCFPDADMKWNSKKWRNLMFMSNNRDLIFSARQYPFSLNEEAMNQIKDIMEDIFKVIKWSDWTMDLVNSYKIGESTYGLDYFGYIGMGDSLKRFTEVIKDNNKLHYNDLLYSTIARPRWTYAMGDKAGKINLANHTSNVKLGAEVPCVLCGKNDIPSSESMLCSTCEVQYGKCEGDDYILCSQCQEVVHCEDGVWTKDDDFYCVNCAEEHLVICDGCGYYFDPNRQGMYVEESGEWFCDVCGHYI